MREGADERELTLAYGVASAAGICDALWAVKDIGATVPMKVLLDAQALRDKLAVAWEWHRQMLWHDIEATVVEARDFLAANVDQLNSMLARKGARTPHEVLAEVAPSGRSAIRLAGGESETRAAPG